MAHLQPLVVYNGAVVISLLSLLSLRLTVWRETIVGRPARPSLARIVFIDWAIPPDADRRRLALDHLLPFPQRGADVRGGPRLFRPRDETFRPPADFRIDGFLGDGFRALWAAGGTSRCSSRPGRREGLAQDADQRAPAGRLLLGMEAIPHPLGLPQWSGRLTTTGQPTINVRRFLALVAARPGPGGDKGEKTAKRACGGVCSGQTFAPLGQAQWGRESVKPQPVAAHCWKIRDFRTRPCRAPRR